MLSFVFLTESFYSDYAACSEIEKKVDRPHAQVMIETGGKIYCIPFRSHIQHEYALFTDKKNHCGLDFSKTVVITDASRYIDRSRKPHLRQNEYAALKDIQEYEVARRLKYYIAQYKKAKEHPAQKRNALLLKYSTLRYFEEFI